MNYNTSDICDLFADSVDVVEPIFIHYGGVSSFGGEITTVKCHEDRGLIERVLSEPGEGKVLLIDGGGSSRRAIINALSAQDALDNGWEGIICYGSVKDVDALADIEIAVLAVGSIPVGADCEGIGDIDIPVNFAGVTFLPEDHVYGDSTGVVLSPEPLDLD